LRFKTVALDDKLPSRTFAELAKTTAPCHHSWRSLLQGMTDHRRPSMKSNRIAAAALAVFVVVSMAVVPTLAAGKSQTLTGQVSDVMCGAKHENPAKSAECTRGCVKHGSKYALVVGDKVYTLETSDQAALDKLNGLAGAKAKVTGELEGDTMTVKSVSAGS